MVITSLHIFAYVIALLITYHHVTIAIKFFCTCSTIGPSNFICLMHQCYACFCKHSTIKFREVVWHALPFAGKKGIYTQQAKEKKSRAVTRRTKRQRTTCTVFPHSMTTCCKHCVNNSMQSLFCLKSGWEHSYLKPRSLTDLCLNELKAVLIKVRVVKPGQADAFRSIRPPRSVETVLEALHLSGRMEDSAQVTMTGEELMQAGDYTLFLREDQGELQCKAVGIAQNWWLSAKVLQGSAQPMETIMSILTARSDWQFGLEWCLLLRHSNLHWVPVRSSDHREWTTLVSFRSVFGTSH